MSTCEQCGDVTKCLMAATLNNAANDIGLFYGGVGYGSLSKETVRGYQRYVPVCPLKQELITSIQKASGKVGKTNTN